VMNTTMIWLTMPEQWVELLREQCLSFVLMNQKQLNFQVI
jgi:hypothetical protein